MRLRPRTEHDAPRCPGSVGCTKAAGAEVERSEAQAMLTTVER